MRYSAEALLKARKNDKSISSARPGPARLQKLATAEGDRKRGTDIHVQLRGFVLVLRVHRFGYKVVSLHEKVRRVLIPVVRRLEARGYNLAGDGLEILRGSVHEWVDALVALRVASQYFIRKG